MNSCNGDVGGVFRRPLRDQPVTEETRDEEPRFGRECEDRNTFQFREAARGETNRLNL